MCEDCILPKWTPRRGLKLFRYVCGPLMLEGLQLLTSFWRLLDDNVRITRLILLMHSRQEHRLTPEKPETKF